MAAQSPSNSKETLKRRSADWLRERLFPSGERLIQLASYVILFSVLITFLLFRPLFLPDIRFYGTILILALLLILNILWEDIARWFATPEQGEQINVYVSGILSLAATWMGELTSGMYLVFMVCAQANIIFPRVRHALAFTVALCAGFVGLMSMSGVSGEGLYSLSISMAVAMVFVVTLSQVLVRYSAQTRRAEDLLRQLQAANAELVAARQKEKDLAVAEERVRLARDIHDGLGHHLTVLSIQLQAAEKLLGSSPEMAAEAVRLSRSEAQAALKEVRQSVAALRQTPVDGRTLPEALAALVEDFDQRSALKAMLRVEGDPAPAPAAVSQTLYRAVQEGLTNAQKHAREASQVEVLVRYEARNLRIAVLDDGKGPAEEQAEGGYGLAGIRERVSQLSGTFSCGPAPQGGFGIEICIPIEVDNHDPGNAGR